MTISREGTRVGFRGPSKTLLVHFISDLLSRIAYFVFMELELGDPVFPVDRHGTGCQKSSPKGHDDARAQGARRDGADGSRCEHQQRLDDPLRIGLVWGFRRSSGFCHNAVSL